MQYFVLRKRNQARCVSFWRTLCFDNENDHSIGLDRDYLRLLCGVEPLGVVAVEISQQAEAKKLKKLADLVEI